MPVAHKPAAVFTHGRGSWLWDSEGRSHLDLVQGWAVNTLGHAPPEISAALATQSQRLLQPGPGLHNDRAAALAQRLAQLTGLHHAFFTSSGAEANEGAVKLARRYGQKHRGGAFEVITFDNSFHGRTLAMMSASGKPGFDSLFAPGVPGFPKARLNDLASVQALVNERTAAVMVEPIQGEAGVLEAQPEFLLGLRRLCDAHGLLLIFDEVQTGVGRTGRLWGFEHSGVRPDVMTLGKGLGGGVPIGALLASEAASCFNLGDQGGTYNGNPLVCAVALAVLEVVTASGFLQQVRERGVQLREGLADLGRRVGGGPVSGQGLLLALPLAGAEQASNAAVALLARASVSRPGLLVNAVRPNRLRFAPALNVQPNELNLGLALLATAL
ncbi:MAG: aminotransferase class III-fold pyridoxal phosphate-dependent enzyme [Rubrivivax sp.]|jgi:acetylornithine/N-succinyldiaminopimelate aminotransferase